MNKYMNKFFCMIAATVASYAVNIVYNLHSAFAVIWETGQDCGTFYVTRTNTMYLSTTCTRSCSTAHFYLNIITHSMERTLPSGYSRLGCTSYNSEYYYGGWSSAGATCSYGSTELMYSRPNAVFKTFDCGTAKWCDGSGWVEVRCNTAGNAGYISGLTGCNCCPGAMLGDGSYNVYADYDAMAAADCYIVGEIKDETGLFQYTDDNRCYYAS